MTSFNDATFRSQQMLAPYQMQGAMNKTVGIQQIGQAASGAADQLMRGVESSVRIQAFQQEQQLNAYKMQQMLALDQAMLSRHGVTAAEAQADMARLQRDEAAFMLKERMRGMERDDAVFGAKMRNYLLDSYGGVDGLIASGAILGPDGQIVREPTDEQRQEFISRYGEARESGRVTMPERDRISREMDRLSRIMRDPLFMRHPQRDAIERQYAELSRQYDGMLGTTPQQQMSAPPAQQPPPVPRGTQPQQPPPMSPARQAFLQATMQSDQWGYSPFWQTIAPDEETKMAVSEGVAAYSEMFLDFQRQQGKNIDPAQAHRFVMQQVSTNPTAAAFLLMLDQDDDMLIEAKLRALFPEAQPEMLRGALRQAREDADRLLGER